MLMPTPVAMPDAIEPMSPDIMPPPPEGAAAGGGAGAAAAGGGACCAAGGGGRAADALCAGGGALRWGAETEVRAPLLRGMAAACCGGPPSWRTQQKENRLRQNG